MEKSRLWEVDFARGIAIILMVIFNWSFALRFLNIYMIDGGWLYWWLFPRLIGGAFIFLAGTSLILSYNRTRGRPKKEIYRKYLLRGFKISLLGVGITIVTWLFFPSYTIMFGILHLIGISIILSPIFLRFRNLTLLSGSIILITAFFIQSIALDSPFFFWLGFEPVNFQTFDYWPVLPWFGVLLIGMFIGSLLYGEGKRRFTIKDFSGLPVLRNISSLGRKSLFIYLIHQPALVALLYLLGFQIFG